MKFPSLRGSADLPRHRLAVAALMVVAACQGIPPLRNRRVEPVLSDQQFQDLDRWLWQFSESREWNHILVASRLMSEVARQLLAVDVIESSRIRTSEYVREVIETKDRWGNGMCCEWLAGGRVLVIRSGGPDGVMDTYDDLALVRRRSTK